MTVQTTMQPKAFAAMARALRKTLRRKRSRRTRIFAAVVTALAILSLILQIWTEPTFTGIFPMALIAVALPLITVLEDRLNGWVARRQALAGIETIETRFGEETYCVITPAVESKWKYTQIQCICHTGSYLVLLLDINHAQVLDENGLLDGTPEQLTALLTEKTGKKVISV